VIGQLCRVAKSNVRLLSGGGIKPNVIYDTRQSRMRRLRKEESVLVILQNVPPSDECYVLTRHGAGWVNKSSLTLLEMLD